MFIISIELESCRSTLNSDSPSFFDKILVLQPLEQLFSTGVLIPNYRPIDDSVTSLYIKVILPSSGFSFEFVYASNTGTVF